MADRLPSDHDAVETYRVTVSQVGGTGRPEVELPDDVGVAEGDLVRVVLDGDEYHGRIDSALDGRLVIRRAGANARLAREGEGTNHLARWVDDVGVRLGGSVHLDVVTTGHKYGLRSPGNRVVYTATDGASSSLADIARELDG